MSVAVLSRICVFFLLSIVSPGLIKCLNEVLFHRQHGKYRPNNVVRTENAGSEFECSLHCSRDEWCTSVNYKKSGHNWGLCELNNGSVSDSGTEEKNMAEFTHLNIVNRVCQEKRKVFSAETKECLYPDSCKKLLDKDRLFSDGVYNLQINGLSQPYQVYCHMTEIPGCGGGGWTLVMKTDGTKNTFGYSSQYWDDMRTYQVQEGLEGLTEKETKLASYWSTPFSKICLGMKVQGVTRWLKLDYEASSLYSVIAGGTYQATTAGRVAWKSLISSSSLQPNCNKEGFDIQQSSSDNRIHTHARLGFVANNEHNCDSCDSMIGFGLSYTGCGSTGYTITCGNLAVCDDTDNGHRDTKALGYTLVQ